MKKIYIIGAGQLGSRHLQALKAVKIPLDITVIDPYNESLKVAEERYKAIKGKDHKVRFIENIDSNQNIDLVIIASNSDVRARIIKDLLTKNQVKYMILEKLLFQRKSDYSNISNLIKKTKTKVWVNCSMRSMPFYYDLKKEIKLPFVYTVNGSQYGLVTNAIHYIDHMAFLAGETDYKIDTSDLDHKIIESKRKGFLELNGTIKIRFGGGSIGLLTCFAGGSEPVIVEINASNFRCISKESEQKAWISSEKNDWAWKEVNAPIPFQSERTASIVTSILNKGNCILPGYTEAVKLHLPLLEELRKYLNKISKKKYNYYPFT